MQPYMKTWIEQMKAETEENHRLRGIEREAEAVKRLNKQRELARRTQPLTEQIEELMRSLPYQLRDRPWSMAELTARLQGKYRARPHAQHVGEALRRLGWCRVRKYGNFEGARLWVQPKLTHYLPNTTND